MTTTITDTNSIAQFNRGPLTTYFIPPTSCLSTLTYASSLFLGHYGSVLVDPKCYPLGTLSAADLTQNSQWYYYYCSFYLNQPAASCFHLLIVRLDSPGLCPSGYSTATTFEGTFPGSTILSLGPDTTAALCCPRCANLEYISAYTD